MISNKFICEKCRLFCLELKPLFPPGGAARYFREHGTLPETKISCRNGCHRDPAWGWKCFDPRTMKYHIPRE